MQTQTPPQTCTGCRKQKNPEDFWRYNRTNLTCNACSERHRTRKAKTAAAAAQQNQQQGMREVLRRDARNAYQNKDDHEHHQEQLEAARRTEFTSTTIYTTRDGPMLGSQSVMQLTPNKVKREGSKTSSWGRLSAKSTSLVD
ncbi:hypothetical protein D0862_09849 [Hortaea werneckii]|uniref:GATA-type domain-containing protein n=1 Tax=Hortaea werneckii TaxID=91943 RepID=A0A3M7FRK1_HORWE|nr:hypothetical protein D0862_09849 [Hortaea werneckii]